MKTNTILGFVGAILIALLAINFAVASTSDISAIDLMEVAVNDVVLDSGTTELAAYPGETVPIVIKFTANEDLRDLKVKVEAEGYATNVDTSTSRFDVINGSTYIKRLSLTLPAVDDMDEDPEGFILHVEISNRDSTEEQDYSIVLQKESYDIDFLAIDAPSSASAGDIIALDVIVKNTGGRDADDTFVTASIPELGISKRVYFGDIFAEDNYDDNGDEDTDNEDAKERRLYLVIPADAKSDDYTIQVRASNHDSVATAQKTIAVTGLTVANATATDVTASDDKKVPTSIIVLTVILAIIFVVLLVVLIVLLTKKPEDRNEDFGETSYY